jgi:uncharacterized protein YcfJ
MLENTMNTLTKMLLAGGVMLLSAPAMAQITFYQGEGFRGRAFTAERALPNFKGGGVNNFASSVVVERGNWEVCTEAGFRGSCAVLRKGSYDSLRSMGMNNRISSVRPAGNRRNYPNLAPAPMASPNYEYRRRPRERVYEATVTSVRAVVADREQRCWIEREQMGDYRRDRKSSGGAVVGAIIGGILGHQIGDGSGRTAATVGGAAVGAAIGSRKDRDRNDGRGGGYSRDIQRCETAGRGTPEYWDVGYEYRGTEHWVRMTDPPGRTILVNRRGEPRQ